MKTNRELPTEHQTPSGGSGEPTPKHYWRSIEEREGSAELREALEREFPAGAAELSDGIGRRSFIQLLGASLAVSAVGACTRAPAERILPYTRQPPGLTPGNPLHFATSLALGGRATGLLATSWEGRPTKLEGNPLHPSSQGSSGVYEQAALLQLYDPQRARLVKQRGTPRAWKSFLGETARRLQAMRQKDQGAGLRFLLEPSGSAFLADFRARLAQAYPNARVYSYEPLADDNGSRGAKLAFGQALDAQWDFSQADIVVSLDADFLQGSGLHLRHARAFAQRREPGPQMNRLYAIESTLSITGTVADHRLRMRPSEIQSFALGLAAELARQPGLGALANVSEASGPVPASAHAKWVKAVASDLARHRGRSVVIAGRGQPPIVHGLAHAINAALGNLGQTVRLTQPVDTDEETGVGPLAALTEEIKSGRVDTLVITARNPVYTAPADLDFGARLASVPNSIYHGLYEDETWVRAGWGIPAAHPLETWSDARAHDGTISIAQPLIAPLFNGIPEIELVSAFLGITDKSAYQILKEFWIGRAPAGGFEQNWERWLKDGLVPNTAFPNVPAVFRPGPLISAIRDWKNQAQSQTLSGRDNLEVNFIGDYKVYDGRFANNAWLQELPDPITKVTWDNAALLSPATARRLGVERDDVVLLEYRGRRLEAPVFVLPGHADDTVSLPLGYGRSGTENVARGVGFNAFLLRDSSAPWFDRELTLKKQGRKHKLAITHDHWSMEGRDLAIESTLQNFEKEPGALEHLRGPTPSFYRPVDYDKEPYKWAMAIDLNRCTGCSACVVACQAENNIPVVGKTNVLKSREMHWLRIDRYFGGTLEDPSVVTQPVACVHCEKAPCEYVCPVNATVHSDEGLNEMVYNRCVGTRYCSNNCPYKVRRFNYLHYTQDKPKTERMLMNPDVTVRARGVMEKCTYCVQRIERARIETRIEGRTIRDGELTTACAQACPAQAITFGSLNDANSAVARLHRDRRRYDLLHELGTQPRTAYLARIKNLNPELA
ncbi:MAG TPA: TAT-variant-translocated molybdopterin oxidoreductase [Myxococcaceae bacterium]|nr:TAT-variant-translocated molybdopterin oxidoreductase [Myxococcaceae bacterium]